MKRMMLILTSLFLLKTGMVVQAAGYNIPQSFKQFGSYTTIERNWHYNCRVVYNMWKSQGSKAEENIAYVEVDGERRYLIAVAATFGITGNFVNLKYDDGTVLHCLIMDEKNPHDGLGHYYADIDSDGKMEHVGHMENGCVNVIEWEITHPVNGSGDPSTWFSKVRGKKVVSITAGKGTDDKDSIIQAPVLEKVANKKKGIKLSWSPYDGAEKYIIYRREDTGIFKKIAELDNPKADSYLDEEAQTEGVPYQYKLTVKKDDTESGYRNMETIYRVATPKLEVHFINRGNAVLLKWQQNKDASGYVIYYSTDKAFETAKRLKIKNPKQGAVKIATDKNKKYYFRIKAYKKADHVVYFSSVGK